MDEYRSGLRAESPARVSSLLDPVGGGAAEEPARKPKAKAEKRSEPRPPRPPRRLLRRLVGVMFALAVAVGFVGAAGVWWVFEKYGNDLPDHQRLADYEPPITTRVYAGDGRLLGEYAIERRLFVPLHVVPQRLIDAFLSAEDKTFFSHSGIDIFGIGRAAITNFENRGTGRRLVGASTITQQVAKNFLVGNEVSYERKIKEMILAFRIERAFSKEQILELYLNQIYLGRGAYGVAAAALNYFDKKLDELTVEEAAFLAALPKAPTNYDPERYPQAAVDRRNWVVGRMLEDGHITEAEAEAARSGPIRLHQRAETEMARADYFAEEIRREIATRFGDSVLYEGGLVVHATVDPELQAIADRELQRGLEVYDRRHGWRGPIGRLYDAPGPLPSDWQQQFARFPTPVDLHKTWRLALVSDVSRGLAKIAFASGDAGVIPFSEIRWARPWRRNQTVGGAPRTAGDVLKVGDIIAVERMTETAKGEPYPDGTYGLRQIPAVDGALVAIDPHTGRILAMSGGWSFQRSEFNRATQALRQPGSAFKPFVYLSALEQLYQPNTVILDAPIALSQGPGLPPWRPSNYSNKFYGPTTMRRGLELSRNVMTVRLAQKIGMQAVADTSMRFSIFDEIPNNLSYALGAGETTVARLTAAYAMIVNGGKELTPTLIDRIQNRRGETIYRHDQRPCRDCAADYWADQPVPVLPDMRAQVTDPASAYQVVSMLEGVVQRGTGVRVKAVERPIAGKTGTTNDSKDTWFVGFTPDLAVGVFVGFDEPKTLGSRETGSSAASPIFRDFMIAALEDTPPTPFRVPPEVRLVRVYAKSGRPAGGDGRGVIWEAFKPEAVPSDRGSVIMGVSAAISPGPSSGTGGLY